MRDLASLVAHADMPVLGPLSLEGIDALLDALPPVERAIDLGAGRADVALRLHTRRGTSVIAVERSAALAAEARRRVGARVEVVEGDAAEVLASLALELELAIVLGSTGAFGGWRPTLDALARVPTWLVGDLVSDDPACTEDFFGPLPSADEVRAACAARGEVRAHVRVAPPELWAYEQAWSDAVDAALAREPDVAWGDFVRSRRKAFAGDDARRAFGALAYEAFVVVVR